MGKKSKRSLTASVLGDGDDGHGSSTYSRDLTGSSKNQRISKQINYFSNPTDLSSWIVWLYREFIPLTISNGSYEYITEGTIGGKEASTVISVQPSWSKIHEIISNTKAIDRYRKDKSYLEQVKLIFNEFPWGARILMHRESARDLKIRRDEVEPDDPSTWRAFNIESLQDFRKFIPGLNLILPTDLVLRRKQLKLFQDHWSHVPRLSKEIITKVMTTDPVGNAEPRIIKPLDMQPIYELIINAKIDEASTSSAELELAYKEFLISNPYMSEEEFFTKDIEANDVEEMSKLYETKKKHAQYQVTYLATHREKAADAFFWITGAAKDVIIKELNVQDYHSAYVKLNNHMISKGIADLMIFEQKCFKIKITLGMTLESYLSSENNAIINWATMLKFKEAIALDHANISSFKINTDEMIDNSGTLSDAEFFTKHKCVPMIANSVRVSIIVNGISGSKRFASVSGAFAQLDLKKKTMKKLMRLLVNVENSKEAQDILALEVIQLKKKNSNQDSVNPSANVTMTGSTAPKFKQGSCVHHPLSTTHDTSMCSKSAKKGQQQSKNKEYNKDFAPCSYCLNNEALKSRAESHPRERCFYDPKSPSHREPTKSRSRPAANAAITAEQEEIRAYMANNAAVNSKMADSLNALALAISSTKTD